MTELTFYEEGFLRIRESRNKKLHREHLVELRFIDPKLITVTEIAKHWMILSTMLAVGSMLGLIYLPATQFSLYVAPISMGLALLASVFLFACAFHSKTSHRFRSVTGKTEFVSLTGTYGCFGRARALAKQVQKTISRACANDDLLNTGFLRAEMKAHYKLAEIGAISRDACSDGTARILNKFS